MQRILLLVFCLSAVAFAFNVDHIIQTVNNNHHSTWKAGVNEIFAGKSLNDLKKLCGTRIRTLHRHKLSNQHFSVPDSFDSRVQWPKCPSMSQIRNQAECGSCWAFGAVESLTDRFCVASNQKINPILSAQNLVTCDQNDDGCEGGDLPTAWEYLQNSGLPLEACQPYNIPTCPPAQQPCLNFVPTPACKTNCYGNSTNSTRYYAQQGYSVGGPGDITAIQQEIMTNGPVEAAFVVYADFLAYKSGVYYHQTGDELGGHAVKVIGWGVESGTPYWLIANSWTTYWGDQGYFKIRRGQDDCGIEDSMYAGLPVLS